ELADRAADVGRVETPALELHVLAEQQRRDDRGVGRRAADAVFLERLDQAGFGVARRRLGEVLVGVDAIQRDPVAGLHRRQLAAFVVLFLALGVLAFLVDGQEPRVEHGSARDAEAVLAAGGQLDADGIERGRHHLAGDRALPDKLVQAAGVVLQEARDLRRRAQRRGRADRLVGFLRVLGLGFVDVGLVRYGAGAVVTRDDVADLGDRIDRQRDRVGTHVADQADGAFVSQRHALVQLLRHLHGALGGEAQLARGLLLQGRGGERRRGAALALLAGDVGDLQRAICGRYQPLAGGLGGLAVGDRELLELLPVQLDQARTEGLRRMLAFGLDRPVLARLERLDLLLALDDHPQRRRLHAAGRQTALHLAPQHRRQGEADRVVQRPARLLGVDQRGGDVARVGHRLLDGTRGDLGEHHPLQRLAVQQPALAEDLGHVPADRLALAVRVGRQEDGFGALGRLGDGLDVFLVLL